MKRLVFLIKHIPDIPKTIYLNFLLFDFKQAIKMPIMISRKVKIKEIYRGSVVIPENVKPFFIKIGIEGVQGVVTDRNGYLKIGKEAKICFKGKTSLSRGVYIRATGNITFGNKFYCNCDLSIICGKSITFGDDCILGWNVHIRDCDGHSLFQNGVRINPNKAVQIGNHVWIGQDVKILKGTVIPENSVIAMNSCVTKSFTEPKTIIGGYPAKVIKQNVDWEV